MPKTLVVFYSRSGNTKFVAEQIARKFEAELEEILEKKGRQGMIGYILAGRDATLNRKSEVHDFKKNPAEFDLIFIGTPVWAYNVTPAIRSYLTQYNLEGKRVVLFATQDGSGAEKVFNATRRLIPKAEIISEKYFNKVLKNQDKVSAEITVWLEGLH